MTKYAETTSVSIEQSMAEIQSTLRRYGASAFMFGETAGRVSVAFEMHKRQVQFNVKLPMLSEFERTPEKRILQSRAAQLKEHDQALRQRYRALLLVIKSKLESIESGIETFDEAFLAHFTLPNGQSVGEWAAPQMDQIFEQGMMPRRLALPTGE